MSDYIVSARKYRPQNWHTVVGQKGLVQTLKNAIVGGKLAHAYLFCGPRGVGKTTCARIFAKTINCEHLSPEGEACNECESCQSFNEQRSYNVYELDAASNNGVDQIRELIEQVQIPPQIGRYKVFIIDEVHMLSTAAFNAFLKTLEEPPKHAIFVMATTEKQKILPTILSRCQTYDFQRISSQDIVEQLQYIAGQEGIQAEYQALQVIARKADGGMRDALSVFDQITSFTSGKVTYQATIENLNILDYEEFFKLTDNALLGNIPAALLQLDSAIRKGFDPQYFIGGWASHLRDLMVAREPATLSLIEAGQEVAMRYQQQAAKCTPAFLYRSLQIAADCDFNYRNSRNKRLSVELALINICQIMHPVQIPQTTPQTTPQASQVVPQQPVQQVPQPQAVVRPVASAPIASHPVAQPVAPTPQPAPQQAVPQTAQQRPVAQPLNNPRFSTAMRPGMGPRLSSLNTNSLSTPTVQPAQQSLDLNEPVDDSALRRYWKEYTNTIQTEKLLVNLMLGCMPQLVEGTNYQVTVASEQQKYELDQNMPAVCNYLGKLLQNTHITINVLVDETPHESVAYSPRERLNDMKQTNEEAIDILVNELSLEFA